MKAQAGNAGKGGAGQKPKGAFKYVPKPQAALKYDPEAPARRKSAVSSIASRKPGQRAGMAKNRAAAKKKGR